MSSNTWLQKVCAIYPLAAYMLVFKLRAQHLGSTRVFRAIGYSLYQYFLWNRVTTGLFDHKINTKVKLVEFDAILSIVSVAADAE